MTAQGSQARREQAAYIESMLIELRSMSLDLRAPVLAYFLEMAMMEAHEMAHGIHIDSEAKEDPVALAERYFERS